ncbi:MAG: DUF4912 domain-containing protein, partial [Cyanobium sp.]
MSIRQLRELARTLGISRYSAQTREGLAEAIASKAPGGQATAEAGAFSAAPAASTGEVEYLSNEADLRAIEAELAPAPRPSAETRVVFLPRDPQWAYVFWEISDDDRQGALGAGA